MRLKPEVRISGVQPECVLGLMLVRDAGEAFLRQLAAAGVAVADKLVVSSICDPAPGRGPNSWHPKGRAFDVSLHGIPRGYWADLREVLAAALGPEWDVVLETEQQGRVPHIHCEFEGERIARARA